MGSCTEDILNPYQFCEVCGADDESIKDALLDCTVGRAFWEQVKFFTGVKIPVLHPMTWARDIVDPDVITARDAGVILCGMWSVWMSRTIAAWRRGSTCEGSCSVGN